MVRDALAAIADLAHETTWHAAHRVRIEPHALVDHRVAQTALGRHDRPTGCRLRDRAEPEIVHRIAGTLASEETVREEHASVLRRAIRHHARAERELERDRENERTAHDQGGRNAKAEPDAKHDERPA